MADRTLIDSKKFALNFADSITQKGFDNSKIVEEAKKYLLSYLTAYYLVEDFNNIEKQNFDGPKTETRFADMSFEQLMERVKDLNKY